MVQINQIDDLAVVAKWLTHRFVEPTSEGSIPSNRPIVNENACGYACFGSLEASVV